MNVIFQFRFELIRQSRRNLQHFQKVSMSSKAKMIQVLYRQGLRWCNENQADVSLAQFIPTKVFESPLIDDISLKRLFNERDCYIRKLLPAFSILEEGKLFVAIEKVSEIRDLWKAIFQLNKKEGKDQQQIQARIDYAFLSLRELNKITELLRDCEAARQRHSDSEGVNFQVGQVVQHDENKWRGVIAGWEKVEHCETKTSSVWYTIFQDSGDVILMGMDNKNQVHISKQSKDGSNEYQLLLVQQSDLRLLDDTPLCRVRNIESCAIFDGYDARINCFKPNDSTKYEYHMEDVKSKVLNAVMNSSMDKANAAAIGVIRAVQSLALKFERRIEETKRGKDLRGSSILSKLQISLFRLSRGDVLSHSERLKRGVTHLHIAAI
jgi:hypothetical protein